MTDEYADDRGRALERSLPNNSECERAILGAIILDNAVVTQAIELLRPEDFYVPAHRRIFVAMIGLFQCGTDINPILIAGELRKESGQLESVGGISFITNLTYGLPHSSNIANYAKIVYGSARLRSLIKASAKTTAEAFEQTDDPDIIIENAVRGVLELAEEQYVEQLVEVSSLIEDVMIVARETEGHGSLVTGLSTGLADLDTRMGGMQKQHLIIVAARPSMGKSTLGSCIAENVTVGTEEVVVIFSLEMSKQELAMRILCSRARVDSMRLRANVLSAEEWDNLAMAALDLRDAKIIIDDSFNSTTVGMYAKCRRVQSKYGRLDLAIVDYIQLMSNSDKKHRGSREQEVSDISRELKGMAKTLDIPLIGIAQLSRMPEGRPNKRPILSDLRESGALEQNADEVVFIYREAYYQRMMNQPITDEFLAEVNVAKARSGRTGVAPVRFEERITRFENLAREHE